MLGSSDCCQLDDNGWNNFAIVRNDHQNYGHGSTHYSVGTLVKILGKEFYVLDGTTCTVFVLSLLLGRGSRI